MLTNRLGGGDGNTNNMLGQCGARFKELISHDPFVRHVKLLDDIVISRQTKLATNMMDMQMGMKPVVTSGGLSEVKEENANDMIT